MEAIGTKSVENAIRRFQSPSSALTRRSEGGYGGLAALVFRAAKEGAYMDEAQSAAARQADRVVQQKGGLVDLAGRIAHGWADRLGVGRSSVEWVAVGGTARGPLAPDAEAPVRFLEGGAGVAFVLGAPGLIDVLFVVRSRGASYWVNISSNARPWDPGERHGLRPGYLIDMRVLMDAVTRYARRAAP